MICFFPDLVRTRRRVNAGQLYHFMGKTLQYHLPLYCKQVDSSSAVYDSYVAHKPVSLD